MKQISLLAQDDTTSTSPCEQQGYIVQCLYQLTSQMQKINQQLSSSASSNIRLPHLPHIIVHIRSPHCPRSCFAHSWELLWGNWPISWVLLTIFPSVLSKNGITGWNTLSFSVLTIIISLTFRKPSPWTLAKQDGQSSSLTLILLPSVLRQYKTRCSLQTIILW